MKQKRDPAQTSFTEEGILDSFAGGSGASTGIEIATGRVVTWAINHDPDAILMHKTNHPYTEHYTASVWDVDPVEVCKGRPVRKRRLPADGGGRCPRQSAGMVRRKD